MGHIHYIQTTTKFCEELNNFQSADKESIKKVSSLVISLRELTLKLQPVLEMESHGKTRFLAFANAVQKNVINHNPINFC
jgi:hypothetical protein